MTLQRLREVHSADPFSPFILYLADGGTVRVSHPESLAYSMSGRTVVIVLPDESTQFVDLLLVSRIEVSKNGRRKAKGA